MSDKFTPLNYAADKTATITVTGQSQTLPGQTKLVRVYNKDATNFARIAFGKDAATAEASAANGVVVPAKGVAVLGVPFNRNVVAWLGDTGSVSLNIVFGS